MATFESFYVYLGDYNAGGNTFTPRTTLILPNPIPRDLISTDTDGAGDLVFQVGDTVIINFPILGPFVATYLAHTADGWVATGQGGDGHIFLSTNPNLNIGEPITTIAEDFTTCFLTGTMIATPDGERPVETLAIGDIILAADGSTRAIRWLGKQSVVSVFANPIRSYPIQITAGALGGGLPRRDLFLSPDHALLVDDVLVQAGALVNNTSITRLMQPGERFTYYHIETEDHALILAEGAPVETFVDNVSRRTFDNYSEYEALYGEEAVIPELDQPRAMSQRQVPRATRERLAALATALGYRTEVAA